MLEKIKSPDDLRSLNESELESLCSELRTELIDNISRTGGHLASNLGTVELTVALLRHFSVPKDSIVWDVGHQSYTYKLLTGRNERFSTLRTYGGLSGFPSPAESSCDAFQGGHSSISVSAALGILKAKRLRGDESDVVAVIGDGALGGGEAFEGLNNAGSADEKLIVVLNDNGMSISKNVGRLAAYLTRIRNRKGYFSFKSRLSRFLTRLPLIGKPVLRFLTKLKFMLKYSIYRSSTMFEDLGFVYLGPVNGHSIRDMDEIFSRAKKISEPCIIHVKTVKGKGYGKAEENPCLYHGVGKFDIGEGAAAAASGCFSSVFGETICDLAEKDSKICAVTAAMSDGTGLAAFSKRFPGRFFDVGICEEHAVTFSAGLSRGGMKPVFCVYSTFLQRSLDQLIHDCAILSENVVLGIDRAGLVPGDGVTHQGIFDTVFLKAVPGITVYAPADYSEMRHFLEKALSDGGVSAVRYPKGTEAVFAKESFADNGGYKLRTAGGEILLVTFGREIGEIVKAAEILASKGAVCDIMKLDAIIPLPDCGDLSHYRRVFFFEEGFVRGGTGEGFFAAHPEIKACSLHGIDGFVPQGTVSELLSHCLLDSASIVRAVLSEACDEA